MVKQCVFLIVALACSGVTATAQPTNPPGSTPTNPQILSSPITTQQLVWTQDGIAQITTYEVRVNGVKVFDVAPNPAWSDANPPSVPFPANLPLGDHRVTLVACIGALCSVESAPLYVRLTIAQTPPGTLSWREGTLSWTANPANVTQFNVKLNGDLAKSVGVAANQTQQSATLQLDVKRLNTVTVEACYRATATDPLLCVASSPLMVPAQPQGLRLRVM